MGPLDMLRNVNLNSAYRPKWQPPEGMNPVIVPQGNTQFDPFAGTGWGQWLDAAGAGDPNGVRMAGGPSPTDSYQIRGLRSAMLNKPVTMAKPQMASVSTPRPFMSGGQS